MLSNEIGMIPYTPATSASHKDCVDSQDYRSKLGTWLFPVRRSLRPGPLEHAFDRLSLHVIGARLGFQQRFDRAANRLMGESGGAVSPRQAAAHFGSRLFFEIDPQTLRHRLDEKFFDGQQRRWIGEHFLDSGDWRNILSPLEKSPAHLEIIEICATRRDFRSGRRYRKYAKMIEQGRPPRRNARHLDTISELDAYFQYYVDLIENIERNGILPRNHFQQHRDTGHQHRSTRSLWQDLVERDIGVAIAEDGRLVRHTSGKHRLAAAIGLGLDRIPVEVRMVHVRWLHEQMRRFALPPTEALAAALEERFLG
ncbi:hypothetical protein IB238_04765 [Rhizobium sp. ARZ01]|uniref:hypothetical protein n=1 Tax=Rhizobium sp. ARZ01 TaxID=2769313 RepID=UPI0017855049|nr:hypothetical protein [Rhizobium sp. ARZ01]MBD9371948.1 hypothetical protein [Rhizobium sp. ARZ01]